MISADKKYTDSINSSVRNVKSLAIMHGEGSGTYGTVFRKELKSYDIQRVGEGKFFGFGVCQRANIKLIDINNSKTVTTSNYFKIGFDVNGSTYPYPKFYVSEVHRDEITGELSITAYDLIYKASKHTVSELSITSYTIKEFTEACATLIGAQGVDIVNVSDNSFNISYADGANFDGTETIREALDAVAEATQTIYYVNKSNKIPYR